MLLIIPFVLPFVLPFVEDSHLPALADNWEETLEASYCLNDFAGTISKMNSAESAPVDSYTDVQSAEGPTPCLNVPRKKQSPPLPIHNQSLQAIKDHIMCTQPNFDIVTPVCFNTFEILLKGYNHRKAHWLIQGFKNGFELGY